MVADNRLVISAEQRDVQGENWILKYYGPLCVIRKFESVPGIGSSLRVRPWPFLYLILPLCTWHTFLMRF